MGNCIKKKSKPEPEPVLISNSLSLKKNTPVSCPYKGCDCGYPYYNNEKILNFYVNS